MTKPINDDLKKVAMPPELLAALKKNKIAFEFYNSLPPSHQKEYVKWIAEAKKDETRQNRIDKTIEKLLATQPRK